MKARGVWRVESGGEGKERRIETDVTRRKVYIWEIRGIELLQMVRW